MQIWKSEVTYILILIAMSAFVLDTHVSKELHSVKLK